MAFIEEILRASPALLDQLRAVAALGLSDCWIAAGAVRNRVWDRLHGFDSATPPRDIDVVWFDPVRADPSFDRAIEQLLFHRCPGLPWSVKNQARMWVQNGDAPYRSTLDALCFWPETATATAARLTSVGGIEIANPFGFDDLVGLILRPTHPDRPDKLAAFEMRMHEKRWLERWPRLTVAAPRYISGT